MINQRGFISGFILFIATAGAGAELPQYSKALHLGVASCASGVCHGSVSPRSSTDILQNEYVVWSRLDRHKNAYSTLLSARSKKIARNLGLKNAHEAKICLDCHADNVAAAKKGTRFQIEDGIGCEACHGGAENYLTSHTDKGVSREQNLSNGLYATDQIAERAVLCFSCHIGSEGKIASHEIMGAGHPRLSFELDTFGVLQPAHYVVDEKYRERKWAGSSLTTWALGQVEASKQTLRLIESKLGGNQLFPELSLFDCHACHHVMSKKRWQQQDRIRQPPGTVRLNDFEFADGGRVPMFAGGAARIGYQALRKYGIEAKDISRLFANLGSDKSLVGKEKTEYFRNLHKVLKNPDDYPDGIREIQIQLGIDIPGLKSGGLAGILEV